MDTPVSQSIAVVVRGSPVLAVLIVIALLSGTSLVYNLYFHPLSIFSGPWYFAASDLPYAITQLLGTSQYTLATAHARYGDVVRIGPNALTFTNPKAWDGLYGLRKGGIAALPKDPLFYSEMLLGDETITRVSDTDAIPIRRAMNAAFAPKNLLLQESMLKEHIERLMSQLATESEKSVNEGVDVRKWLTMSMFDINSHFSFGEDMGCVRNGKYHHWVQFVVDFFYAATLIHQCHKFWPLAPLLASLMPSSVQKAKAQHNEASLDRVRRRMGQDDGDRTDFMHHFVRQAQRDNLSKDIIEAQASVVILAGSETSGVGLTSTVFQVLSHPTVYRRLCEEICTLFPTVADVTLLDTLNKLPFLHAVIWEALRIHAPLANGFTRVVPEMQKDFVAYDGVHLPASTVVHINHYAINTSPRNFRDPLAFIPERWLGDSKYKDDQREAMQPFSVGPRNCPGRNFAMNNMKLAMVYLIMTFSMELCEGMQGWDQGQKIYNGWLQPPLMVRLRKRA
ncbi:cytochrome P450 [Lecanosticta acicola]|uniref:Cytochrome P450 n=1 Tax=Lecanosticta acicola TaxID=111012 RepID=A0AAI8YS97_9PEZI|nr:cytochrome P450 [Lecanosticta acicola]